MLCHKNAKILESGIVKGLTSMDILEKHCAAQQIAKIKSSESFDSTNSITCLTA